MMDDHDDSLVMQKCYKLKNTLPYLPHFDSKATIEEIFSILEIYFRQHVHWIK